MNMPLNRQSAGGLSADDGIRLLHLRGHKLKPNGNLVTLLPETLRHPVQYMSGGKTPDYRPPPALVFQKRIIQHHQNVVGMEKTALIVNDPQPIRISIRGNPNIAIPVQHIIL